MSCHIFPGFIKFAESCPWLSEEERVEEHLSPVVMLCFVLDVSFSRAIFAHLLLVLGT